MLTTLFIISLLVIILIKDNDLSERDRALIARAETKADLLLRHYGINYEDEMFKRVVELVKADNKDEAVKLYRAYSGKGLNEAEGVINRLDKRLNRSGEDDIAALLKEVNQSAG